MLGGMSKARESSAASRWRKIVRDQAASGLSVAAYCRRARVPASSFYAWRRKLRDVATERNAEASAEQTSPGTFTEVRVTPALHPTPASAYEPGVLELHLSHGRRVIVRSGFDRETLRALVATLEVCEPTAGTTNAAGVDGTRECGLGREAGA